MFWLVSVLLGWSYFKATNDLAVLALWVLAVFLSILLHEFGHVLMGQFFGSSGFIILHGFGGLAVGSSDLSNRWKRIAVTLAGPGIQLVLWGILQGIIHASLVPDNPKIRIFILMLSNINLFWPLLNLIPVYPLDGGQVLLDSLTYFSANGRKQAFGISVAAGIGAAIYFGNSGQLFLVFLFVLLIMQNLELVR
ncbi:MAG: hypothetical protein EXR99_02165 [Gemmataceae bacterium]|nr:hypothetical protein [Gemmataceae bacterium]